MSIHSKDGTTWSDRLERIGVLSASNKDMVFNNLGHHINIETLGRCFDRLDGTRAVGIDGVTKQKYGRNLAGNLRDLLERIRKGTYQPKPARIVQIPKDDGDTRPLAISCIEDKLVQMCVNNILARIYEPLFLPCSWGARPNRSCHDALREVNQVAFRIWDGAVVEIDLRKYFNSIPHSHLLGFLGEKIGDTRFMALIEALLRAPTTENGVIKPSDIGAPQGSILSPLVANVYLHHVLDQWFAQINGSHFRGMAREIRYMDDAIFFFPNMRDAERFFEVLPKRLEKFGLLIHPEKSHVIPSGRLCAGRAAMRGERIPVYKFLGFEFFWEESLERKFWRLKVRSRSDRLRKTLKRLKAHLRLGLNTAKQGEFLRDFVLRVKGWLGYHAVSDNEAQVRRFLSLCRCLLIRWFRRRGARRKMTWEILNKLLPRIGFPQKFRVTSLFQAPNHAKA